MATFMENPEKSPVWLNTDRCKACDVCVDVCPAGVLSMDFDKNRVLGKMVTIIHPEACIGCKKCELSCPDFAIFVAEKDDGATFGKLTPESKERAELIKNNNHMMPKA
jgi:2-oxoglutarate ferredoxin oxidoreductase subunit delta